jgi:hypothetical protein
MLYLLTPDIDSDVREFLQRDDRKFPGAVPRAKAPRRAEPLAGFVIPASPVLSILARH